LLTKNGQLQSFATSLVDDGHSRILRQLVDSGYLTYEYTGTQRVYTVIGAGGSQFPVRREGKTVAKKKVKEATNGHVEEGPKERADETPAVDRDLPAQPAERKAKKKVQAESAPAPVLNNDGPQPARTRSKPQFSHPDLPSPTLTDLLVVGEIAAQHGGAKKLLGVVALVDDLAKRVGGIDRLRGALEGLETLAKLFK
jgi:hypothetical protein